MDPIFKYSLKNINIRSRKRMYKLKFPNDGIFSYHIFGQIYLATNDTNGKVYVGKVEFPRTIDDRWKEHLKEGRRLKRLREQNPHKKIRDTHLNNAIAKYCEKVWNIQKIDKAFSKEELNQKETFWIVKYNSIDPAKGYNMTLGGEGGRLREEVKNKIRKSIIKKFEEDPRYKKKIGKASKERMKDPKYKEKILKHLNKGLERKRKDPEFRKKISKFITERNLKNGEDPEYIKKQIESHKHQKKNISDLREFLTKIKDGKESRELEDEYHMSRPTLNKRIHEILGKYNVKNYKEAKRYLKDKDLDIILEKE